MLTVESVHATVFPPIVVDDGPLEIAACRRRASRSVRTCDVAGTQHSLVGHERDGARDNIAIIAGSAPSVRGIAGIATMRDGIGGIGRRLIAWLLAASRCRSATAASRSRCASSRALGDVPRSTSGRRRSRTSGPLRAHENAELHVDAPRRDRRARSARPELHRAVERERVGPRDVGRVRAEQRGREPGDRRRRGRWRGRPSTVTATPNGDGAGRSAIGPTPRGRASDRASGS